MTPALAAAEARLATSHAAAGAQEGGAGVVALTSAHRTCLRRALNGQPLGDLAHLGSALFRAGLLRLDPCARCACTNATITPKHVRCDACDALVPWRCSADGEAVLAAHDALGETRRSERPRLEPKPLPPRWGVDLAAGLYVHEEYGPLLRLDAGPTVIEERIRIAGDALDLYRWIQHSRAFEAQEAAGEAPSVQR